MHCVGVGHLGLGRRSGGEYDRRRHKSQEMVVRLGFWFGQIDRSGCYMQLRLSPMVFV